MAVGPISSRTLRAVWRDPDVRLFRALLAEQRAARARLDVPGEREHFNAVHEQITGLLRSMRDRFTYRHEIAFAALAELCRCEDAYRESGNPLYAFRAWHVARVFKAPCPRWVKKFFENAIDSVMEAEPRDAKSFARLFGFSLRRGPTAPDRAKVFDRNFDVAVSLTAIIKQEAAKEHRTGPRGRSIEVIFRELAKNTGSLKDK